MATVRKDVRNVTQETWVSQAVLLSSCETLGRSLPIPGLFVKVKYTGIDTLPLAVRIKCVEMLGKLQNTMQIYAAVIMALFVVLKGQEKACD